MYFKLQYLYLYHKLLYLCVCDHKSIKHTASFVFVTARKRSLGRLCFYTCLSVILFTRGCLPQCMLTYTPQGADPPRKQTPHTSRHPPGADTPREVDTPREADPPLRSACWEIRATSGWYPSYWNAYLLLL